MRLRRAAAADVPALLGLINGYAARNLLLHRTEDSVRRHLDDFVVLEDHRTVVGCAALSALGPGLGEVRSLAVRGDHEGRGLGHAMVECLLDEAAGRGFVEVLALTRRVSFFRQLGFEVTRRERFLDKLLADCQACPLNLCCDEVAMVVSPPGLPAAAGAVMNGVEWR